MSKIVITVLITVLIGGATLFAIGRQIVPATATAGIQTRTQINQAFQ
ncbi:hypothetical protein ACFQI7_23315 [Paenibacillus allorhizosphaerae]|uniref:Uncharacterized protein n=1 Tax=Paenibacillus allorhizosphaerae TaxID=2849866 RepID=A0ABM8VJY5_9BACL|nr:hypothetical protein [Paenibacillus allorhizosphaerae]CAG7646124.1 hypothetical protein PAECIP111802_03664 [Paenibacillus allorhizosphaerae]